MELNLQHRALILIGDLGDEGLGQSLRNFRMDFSPEVQTVDYIHQINLVRLLGFCAKRSDKILVYEYTSSGSLHKRIFHENLKKKLLGGALERKSSTKHIFTRKAKNIIIQLDIKLQKIFLDEIFNAKLFDFGLANVMDCDQSQVMTKMKGTRGYMASKMLSTKRTEKVDLYSFRVVSRHIDKCNLPKRFSYEALKFATQNFDVDKRLGGGGFGSTMDIIHHINLVKLSGFCAKTSHRLLVYEYMSCGLLDKRIFHGNLGRCS
ncbi:hypothetical protein RJ639_014184 [Escallonia herrerae]|uniref:Protein kinase domain-containing protein n=1 Tax=Escallonia herrerae TaxID=1293975 RepID=A0AA88VID6_9ASTE|nr:hypothetical protein RJ639_014184 [Escallonia herrerae]